MTKNCKVYLACDHAGFEMKEELKVYLPKLGLGYEVQDMGAFNFVEDDDYPDYVLPLAERVASEEGSMGIILGGSGQGEAMCANRVPGARAAVFYGQELAEGPINREGEMSSDSFEIVKLEREHNNANILSLGVRFITLDEAKLLELIEVGKEELAQYNKEHEEERKIIQENEAKNLANVLKEKQKVEVKKARQRHLASKEHRAELAKAREFRQKRYRRLKEFKDGL